MAGPALVELEDGSRASRPRLEELRLDAEELRLDACLRAGQHREVLAEAQARVAEAPLRERRWALLALGPVPGGTPGRGAAHAAPGPPVLATSWASTPARTWSRWSRRSCARTRRWSPAPPSSRADVPLPRAWCPTTSATPTRSSGATPTSPPASAGWRRRGAGRRRAVGLREVVAGAGRGRGGAASATAAGSSSSRPAPIRWTRSRAAGVRTRPVLVVDQCEEAVTLCDDPASGEFFAALAERADAAPLVVALRADRLGDLSAHPAFARLVERGLYLLGAMARPTCGRRSRDPPARPGCARAGLVDLLVREVEGEPGPCRCCPTPCARRGSGARAARSPSPATADRRDPRRRRPVGRGGLRPGARAAAADAARPAAAPGRPTPTASRCAAGSPRSVATDAEHERARRAARRRPAGDQRRRTSSSWPTRRWPAPGPGCAAGSTTTSRASGSSATSPSPPTRGTPWAGPTASSTGGRPPRSGSANRPPQPPAACPACWCRRPAGGCARRRRGLAVGRPTGPTAAVGCRCPAGSVPSAGVDDVDHSLLLAVEASARRLDRHRPTCWPRCRGALSSSPTRVYW